VAAPGNVLPAPNKLEPVVPAPKSPPVGAAPVAELAKLKPEKTGFESEPAVVVFVVVAENKDVV
jgi:hypothetical protein